MPPAKVDRSAKTTFVLAPSLLLLVLVVAGVLWLEHVSQRRIVLEQEALVETQARLLETILQNISTELENYAQGQDLTLIYSRTIEDSEFVPVIHSLESKRVDGVMFLDVHGDIVRQYGLHIATDSNFLRCLKIDPSAAGFHLCPVSSVPYAYAAEKLDENWVVFYRDLRKIAREIAALSGQDVKVVLPGDEPPEASGRDIFTRNLTGTDGLPVVRMASYVSNEMKRLSRQSAYVFVGLVLVLAGVAVLLARVSRQAAMAELRERQNRELKALTEQRESLLHLLGHDLANAAGVANLSIEMLDRVGLDHPSATEYVERMRTSIGRQISLIKMVRDLQALESGKLKLKLEPVDIHTVLQDAWADCADLAEKKNISLNLPQLDAPLHVLAHRVSFTTNVLGNLLSNAIKFSPNGSQIDIHVEQENGTVRITVEDHGIGMPPEIMEAVFNPHKPTTREGTGGERGTGFGMPLAKRFVEAYGGTVELVSHEKTDDSDRHGTEVTLTLLKA